MGIVDIIRKANVFPAKKDMPCVCALMGDIGCPSIHNPGRHNYTELIIEIQFLPSFPRKGCGYVSDLKIVITP